MIELMEQRWVETTSAVTALREKLQVAPPLRVDAIRLTQTLTSTHVSTVQTSETKKDEASRKHEETQTDLKAARTEIGAQHQRTIALQKQVRGSPVGRLVQATQRTMVGRSTRKPLPTKNSLRSAPAFDRPHLACKRFALSGRRL